MTETETDEVKLWCRYDLSNASLVAIDDESTTFSQTGVTLSIGEGRVTNWAPKDGNKDERSWLAYSFDFSVKGGPEPDESSMRKARIVLTGRHEGGLNLKIHGRGWIGRDNHGQIEGSFDRPPRIDIIEPANAA